MRVIYLLLDPRDNAPKYVGYTKDFATRIHYHYRPPRFQNKIKKAECATYPWLAELAELGLLPLSKILETISDDMDWEERERYWIAYYQEHFQGMLNIEGGGMRVKNVRARAKADPRKLKEWNDNNSIAQKKKWANMDEATRKKAEDNLADMRTRWRPKTRDWHGRYNGAMDIQQETLFDL